MQNQHRIVAFEIIVDRVGKLLLFALSLSEGEVVGVFEMFDVGLCQRCKLFAGINTRGLGVDSLKRVG
jgi:hypothetical protein